MLKKNKKGFTLVEILIALVILSMGIAMLITMFTVGMDGVVANQKRTQATNLAQDLMDEILGKNFDEFPKDIGTAPGDLGKEADENTANRLNWDDVDDYLYLKSADPPPKNAGGTPLILYNDFTRRASVWYVHSYDLETAETSNSTDCLKRISVWVSHSDISTVYIAGLKTRSVY